MGVMMLCVVHEHLVNPNKQVDFEVGLDDVKTYLMRVMQSIAVKDININLIV
jgi:hypothetical protein